MRVDNSNPVKVWFGRRGENINKENSIPVTAATDSEIKNVR